VYLTVLLLIRREGRGGEGREKLSCLGLNPLQISSYAVHSTGNSNIGCFTVTTYQSSICDWSINKRTSLGSLICTVMSTSDEISWPMKYYFNKTITSCMHVDVASD